MKHLLKAITIASTIVATPVLAANWELDPKSSHLAYGTIKLDEIGEVNSFDNLSGHVTEEGKVEIGIDLASVETNIDIRNERMIEHVFRKVATATLSADIDMETISALTVGEATIVDVGAKLAFVATDIDFDAQMYVLRVSDDQVMVSTNDMVFISAEDAGVTDGVDKLMELAQLPGITRTVPVTARFMFKLNE